jgi:hypothetical protein
MGNNLPPGASSDPRAPYNQEDLSKYFPVKCTECGDFIADTPEEMHRHEHAKEKFKRVGPEEAPPCLVCNPPSGKQRSPSDGPYCDSHTTEDYKRKVQGEMERRQEESPVLRDSEDS